MFAESMKSQGLRKLIAVATYDDLLRWRPWWCGLLVELKVDVLKVQLRPWWPWLFVPFCFPIFWLLARQRVLNGIRRLQIPVRVVTVQVWPRAKRPKRK